MDRLGKSQISEDRICSGTPLEPYLHSSRWPVLCAKSQSEVAEVGRCGEGNAAQIRAQDMDAYLMLSFDTFEAKAAFCERFGYDPYSKFIKGEVFDEQVERID